MTRLREESLEFVFAPQWRATKYDAWRFHIDHFQNAFGGCKAVDFVAINAGTLWLIEVKDFRVGPRRAVDASGKRVQDLWLEIAQKVRCTLAGLYTAAVRATNDDERDIAALALTCRDMKVVLHMEQPKKATTLHPLQDVSLLTQKLKQLVGVVDPHPRVVNIGSGRYIWTVNEVPAS